MYIIEAMHIEEKCIQMYHIQGVGGLVIHFRSTIET